MDTRKEMPLHCVLSKFIKENTEYLSKLHSFVLSCLHWWFEAPFVVYFSLGRASRSAAQFLLLYLSEKHNETTNIDGLL